MGIFISVEKTIECVVCALFFACASLAVSPKILGVMQSGGYSGKKLMRWSARHNNMIWQRLGLLALCCALLSAVLALCFSFAGEYAAVISLAAYLIFYIVYAVADKRIALRCPAVKTARLSRLRVVCFTVFFIAAYIIITLLNFAAEVWGSGLFSVLRYVPLAVIPVLTLPLVCLANLIAKIYETPHNAGYVKKAKQKLASSNIKVIAITGSYGKTSVKNILCKILESKYKTLSTPRSHNTPMGVSLAVNGNNLSDYDFFIAEMGARNVGDIAELCAICPPDYSIITGICPQHLESFKTEENIIKAKGEILAATRVKAFIADDCYEKFAPAPCPAERCGCVSEVISDCEGTRFTLTLGGEKRRVAVKLLGEHSAYNIGLAASLAFELGLTIDEIVTAAESLDYIEHRLQLINSNGVNIIDDGYNANERGAAAALKVLRTFGGRKICVTCGLVELGVLEERENRDLGENLAGLDLVILVGDTLITPVKEGYLSAGGDEQKLVLVPTLNAAQAKLAEYIQKGDSVLFLNDLPDVY